MTIMICIKVINQCALPYALCTVEDTYKSYKSLFVYLQIVQVFFFYVQVLLVLLAEKE